MIKLIVFDLDGVLVSTKDLHYNSLNMALSNISSSYVISEEDHRDFYDGLPTKRKLQLLTKNTCLSQEYHDQIYADKQKYTIELIRKYISPIASVRATLSSLRDDGYKIYVASNAIRKTVDMLLLCSGLTEFIDYIISNEDVKNAKPNAEMYLTAMAHAGVNPDDTLIVEDSPRGIEAAQKSKANLLIVRSPKDLSYDAINREIKKDYAHPRLKLNNFNILIPMAGLGSRFVKAGYTFPKPLIEVRGKPMIQTVVENLGIDATYTYVVRKDDYESYNLKYLLNLITPGCNISVIDGLTEGAACTTLLAKSYINNSNSLIIANSDQHLEWNPTSFYYDMVETKADAGIVTFTATHPKWSFVKLDSVGNVIRVAEKKPISDIATVGVYYWKHGADYVKYAEQMINKNIRTNNEFYVAPVFNEAIGDGKRVRTHHINKMFGLGTPEDLNSFLDTV